MNNYSVSLDTTYNVYKIVMTKLEEVEDMGEIPMKVEKCFDILMANEAYEGDYKESDPV